MQPTYGEPSRYDPNCEIRIGEASWDNRQTSVKYTWLTSTGAAARGGEVPIEALPQMLEVAIKRGGLTL
jgi:hypothetical protein